MSFPQTNTLSSVSFFYYTIVILYTHINFILHLLHTLFFLLEFLYLPCPPKDFIAKFQN